MSKGVVNLQSALCFRKNAALFLLPVDSMLDKILSSMWRDKYAMFQKEAPVSPTERSLVEPRHIRVTSAAGGCAKMSGKAERESIILLIYGVWDG